MKQLNVTRPLVSGKALKVPTAFEVLWRRNKMKQLNEKRLLVPGRSPECTDCLLRSMEQ